MLGVTDEITCVSIYLFSTIVTSLFGNPHLLIILFTVSLFLTTLPFMIAET